MDWNASEPVTGSDKQHAESSTRVHARSETDEEEADNQTVSISFCGPTPLLWRAADIRKCREDVGVVGTLVGSLARQPRQNVRLGRPLEILQEEARLLVDTGKATALRHKEVHLCVIFVFLFFLFVGIGAHLVCEISGQNKITVLPLFLP